MKQVLLGCLSLAALLVAGNLAAQERSQFSGSSELEARFFPSSPAYPGQYEHYGLSLALAPEYVKSFSDGRQQLTVKAFLRIDQRDTDRSHADLRELLWSGAFGKLELKLGVGRVFWGVVESRHLVDIVNQTDNLENIDGEDKLGQPMLDLAYVDENFGTFELIAMTGFRTRRYPGTASRLRLPVPVLEDAARFASKLHHWAPDLALRWSESAGPFDLGLSYFYGTSREPQLIPTLDASGAPALVPLYDRIQQGSVDWQATLGGLLLKLEALGRFGQGHPFAALSGGFEYTLTGLVGSADLGVLAEYHYDGRDNLAPNFLNHDLFSGLRLALNDSEDTSILAGATVDVEDGATFVNIEASRRLGETWKLGLEGRGFIAQHAPNDLLYLFRKDSYLELSAQWFF